jgi:hypothetical protein
MGQKLTTTVIPLNGDIVVRGSLVDSLAEDSEQRTLFLVGLYVGLATAFLLLLLPALWRSARRIRGGPSRST